MSEYKIPLKLTLFDMGQIEPATLFSVGCTHLAWNSYTGVQKFCTPVHLYTVHMNPGASLASVGGGFWPMRALVEKPSWTASTNHRTWKVPGHQTTDVRCHGTKCPLFLFYLSAQVTFLPEGVLHGVLSQTKFGGPPMGSIIAKVSPRSS